MDEEEKEEEKSSFGNNVKQAWFTTRRRAERSVHVRFTQEDMDRIHEVFTGENVSTWIRDLVRAELDRMSKPDAD